MTGTHPRSSGLQETQTALLLYLWHQQHMRAVYLTCALHTCGRPWWSSRHPAISKMLWASTLQLRLNLDPWPPGFRAKLQTALYEPFNKAALRLPKSVSQRRPLHIIKFSCQLEMLPCLARPCRLWTTAAVCCLWRNTSQKTFASGCWFLINHSWLFSPT